MWAEVLLLCATGCLYPVALIAVVSLLAGERRIAHAVAFLAGGALVCLATGLAIVIAVRALHLTPHHRRTPGAWVYIGLGIAVIVVAAILMLRARRGPAAVAGEPVVEEVREAVEPDNDPLWKAFVTGVLIYLPMVSYFASAKIIASQSANIELAIVALIPCIIVSLLITEVPIVAVAVAGDRADPLLATVSKLVVRYTRPILLITGAGVGLYLIFKGIGQL